MDIRQYINKAIKKLCKIIRAQTKKKNLLSRKQTERVRSGGGAASLLCQLIKKLLGAERGRLSIVLSHMPTHLPCTDTGVKEHLKGEGLCDTKSTYVCISEVDFVVQ